MVIVVPVVADKGSLRSAQRCRIERRCEDTLRAMRPDVSDEAGAISMLIQTDRGHETCHAHVGVNGRRMHVTGSTPLSSPALHDRPAAPRVYLSSAPARWAGRLDQKEHE